MQKDGIKALRAARYEKKVQTGMFDDMEQEEGWGYLMAKILQLPRSEKFLQMMEARKRLIHRKLKAKLRRQMAEAARAKRMSKSVKSSTGIATGEDGAKTQGQQSARSNVSQRPSNDNASKNLKDSQNKQKSQQQSSSQPPQLSKIQQNVLILKE